MGSKRKAGNPLGIAGGLVGILGSDMGYSCGDCGSGRVRQNWLGKIFVS